MGEGIKVNVQVTESPELGGNRQNVLRSEMSGFQNSLNLNLSHSIDDIRNPTEHTQLISTNQQLNEVIINLQDEIGYLKLREKKIMYLVHLLQAKGYPVTQIFEQQVKPVNTLRFEEFL